MTFLPSIGHLIEILNREVRFRQMTLFDIGSKFRDQIAFNVRLSWGLIRWRRRYSIRNDIPTDRGRIGPLEAG